MKLRHLVATSLIPLNVLLLFFLLFDSRLVVPAWLQVVGRLHPMILHFPIVLILLYAFLQLLTPARYKEDAWFSVTAEGLLLAAASTAAVTALMGILLSKEPGYDPDSLVWHKYSGALTSFVLFLIYSFRRMLNEKNTVLKAFSVLTALLVVMAGHLGANITHGDNFVLAPVTPETKHPLPAFEDAFVFADMVEPILETKCMGCHNGNKAKGELVMETKELLLKGGKDGKLWDTTQADLGLMMQRIHLPAEEKKHMPPSGKPQLTDEEITILQAWIKSGASFDKRVIELAPEDTLRVLATRLLQQSPGEQFNFAAADEKEIEKLSNNNRVVAPLAIGSPALVVNFYNKQFYNSKALEELKAVANQVVELNLDNMPVKDEDLKIIGGFKNLRRLILNFTAISGASLGDLKNLQFLKSLSLSGTAVKPAQLAALSSLPKLRTVYLWNTSVTEKDLADLTQQNKNIVYQTGFKGDSLVLKLTPPILQNDEQVISGPLPLKLKHYINGVTIRYTIDGTEPDSLLSPVYEPGTIIDGDVTVKAKAFKPGWISSDVMQQHFFKSTFRADSAVLLTPADAKYRADGARTLIDLDKSDLNFANGKWLGYQNNEFAAMLIYNKPVEASSITISFMRDINSYIFPPVTVAAWGSMDQIHWTSLGQLQPEPPNKDLTNKENLALGFRFPKKAMKYIRLQATPVKSLPAWHPGKGQKGWIFIDEVFVN
jgi:uncharacterized membrane protein